MFGRRDDDGFRDRITAQLAILADHVAAITGSAAGAQSDMRAIADRLARIEQDQAVIHRQIAEIVDAIERIEGNAGKTAATVARIDGAHADDTQENRRLWLRIERIERQMVTDREQVHVIATAALDRARSA